MGYLWEIPVGLILLLAAMMVVCSLLDGISYLYRRCFPTRKFTGREMKWSYS